MVSSLFSPTLFFPPKRMGRREEKEMKLLLLSLS